MAVAHALARLRREPFDDLPIETQLEQACRDCAHSWRERLLSPLVTLRLLVLQVLHGNAAIAHLRQLAGFDFAPASYCEARARLPLEVILSLLDALVECARRAGESPACQLGRRLLIVDGSNFSMPDTPELRGHFGLPQGTKPGVGYPLAKVMGLVDAATGLFVQMLCLPLFTHDLNAAVGVHAALRPGDVLLGDRAFCSFAHFALLNARGVSGCFRLHQRRKGQGGHGRRRWRREGDPPAWMTREQHASLPEFLDVRLVSYTVDQEGFRSRRVTIATTLLDDAAWPDARLAELYGHRWRIEGCFDELKTHMGMNVLKCRSLDGVMKELAAYLLVYNMVRLAMLRAAARQRVPVGRVSFVDALRWLACRCLGLDGVEELVVNPRRPGRWEPRVLRRRMKPHDWLTCPRAELKKAMESGAKC